MWMTIIVLQLILNVMLNVKVIRNFKKLVYGSFFEIYHMIHLGQFQRHFLSYGHFWAFAKIITSFPSLITSFLSY
jgi:hypothetical protein